MHEFQRLGVSTGNLSLSTFKLGGNIDEHVDFSIPINMASASRPVTAPKERRMQTKEDKGMSLQLLPFQSSSDSPSAKASKYQQCHAATKFAHCEEINGREEDPSNVQQVQQRAVNVKSSQKRRRSLRLQSANLIEIKSKSVQQGKTSKRPREEDETPLSRGSPKRARASKAPISEARIDYWTKNGSWPTEEQDNIMHCFRDIVQHALARKRLGSLNRKRSNASSITETASTQTPSSQQSREQKSAPYRHPLFEDQLKECGSFMDDYEEGITAQSERLCQTLLKAPQAPPEHTLFSDDNIFKKTCKRIRGENENKVIRDISPLIVPSAEILADKGVEHLEVLRETTSACWINAIPFIRPGTGSRPGCRPGPRPQPDFSLGFKRDAFNQEQLQKLQPFVGNPLSDSSLIAATYNMYLPFLTSEVKCGASALDVADRQNAHSQTVALRGLATIFQLVGREHELHREINGFSISHSDKDVRIWGHYTVLNGRDFTFYRYPIAEFNISPTAEGDQRWKAYTFVRNVYDLWLPGHFRKICSAIDMLPADLDFEVADQPELQSPDQELASSRSGQFQRLDDHSLADERAILNNQPRVAQITPDTTIQTELSNFKRAKR
ncbi:hypothetical protein PRK78_005315 [Emydomyces testavorans]|uniref:DUF7924 domain-containing protein n=1 Tax=Emydomyces testavorans TaxID=2070801 RepID=A0AAF0IMH6_9EURO|nr:hypothetical protein PRK78_005315 [Emydomyces testavorans]